MAQLSADELAAMRRAFSALPLPNRIKPVLNAAFQATENSMETLRQQVYTDIDNAIAPSSLGALAKAAIFRIWLHSKHQRGD